MSKFMKRDELTKSVLEKMQSWYEIRVEGKDPVTKYTTNVFFLRILTNFITQERESLTYSGSNKSSTRSKGIYDDYWL